jgi:hypothetical protein
MSWDDVGVIAIAIGVFVIGLLGARSVARLLLTERARREDIWEPHGIVHGSDMALRIALLFVWAGFALGSLSLLPGLAWAIDGDPEARTVALRILMVGAGTVAFGLVASLPGLRLLVIEDEQLTRAGVFRDVSLPFPSIERVDEARTMPALVVRGIGTRIRIPRSAAGFDDMFNRLVESIAPDVLHANSRSPSGLANVTPDGQSTPTHSDGRYAVGRMLLRLNIGFLVASFLFFLLWPWFVVGGEHPIRDSFIFVGIGLLLWLALATLVSSETLQKGQPIELELRDSTIAWRTLRGDWRERNTDELVSASVETWIMYVKGQPGRRYPLRLRFIGDEVLQIDDYRGRQLGSSTHLLGVDIRQRYLTTHDRSSAQEAASVSSLVTAKGLEAGGSPLESVEHYRAAIALWPSPENLALYGHVADVLRLHGERPEQRTAAIAHYRAHVDFHPSDATAWQSLGACLSGGLRNDAAEEAIATAEQLLSSGRDVSPPT